MKTQINTVIKEGYRPVIFIDDWLLTIPANQEELKQIKARAKQLNVMVVHSPESAKLHAFARLYVFRYGDIPMVTQATILRRNGRIVSGSLVVKEES